MAEISYRVSPSLDATPKLKYERLTWNAKAVDSILRRATCNHGRYTAEPFLLSRGRLADLSESEIASCLAELESAEIIQRYESDGEVWLWFPDTDQMHSKRYLKEDRPKSPYPAPPGYVDPKDTLDLPRTSPGDTLDLPRTSPGDTQDGSGVSPRRNQKPETRNQKPETRKQASPPAPAMLIARGQQAGGQPSPPGPGLGSAFDVDEIFPDHPIRPDPPDPPQTGDGLNELWDEYEQARVLLAASGHPVKAQDGERGRLAILVKHRGLAVVTEALRQVQIRKARAPTNRMGNGPILDLMTVLDGFATQLVTKEHLENGQGGANGERKKQHKSHRSKPGYWDDFVQPDPNYRPAA